MKVLAGLNVTAKAIERSAEAIGAEIARRDEQEISRAKQLVLPVVSKQNTPKMYVLVDGVQVPVVAAEAEGRTGRIDGQKARTRECKLGSVLTQTTVDPDGWPIRDPGTTTYDPAAKKLWMTPMKDLLDEGNIEPLVTNLREIAAAHSDAPGLVQEVLKDAEYFATKAHRMRYPEFRERG